MNTVDYANLPAYDSLHEWDIATLCLPTSVFVPITMFGGMKTFIITTCFVAVAWVISWLIERKRMRGYWSRACMGAQWRQRFPHASKADIRQFLKMFVDAFGFSRSRRLRFTPDDRVIDVYRTLHPPKWTLADSMELESLMLSIHRDYGIDLVPLWREDITLGELFTLTRPKSAEQIGGATGALGAPCSSP